MKRIGIASGHSEFPERLMIGTLSGIVGCETVECDFDPADGSIDAWVLPHARTEDIERILAADRPCLAVLADEPREEESGDRGPVRFTKSSGVPAVLAGRSVMLSRAREPYYLPSGLPMTDVIALHADRPVWATHATAMRCHHFASSRIPSLADGKPICTHFNQDEFFSLLPLLVFLQRVASDDGWEGPPLQACFMFDDPNLHWGTYGFLDFQKMADHAELHDYHGSFATIPLDGWFVHQRTASLFRRRADRISLLIHGNDHVNHELARDMDDSERIELLSQALWRIDKLERRGKIDVARVMAPPHGACSEAMLHAMARLGYEAACISRGSLAAYNANARWLPEMGMRPSEIVGGLPVLPRFRISATCQNAILVSALLRQPIIPVGHHQDVAAGLDLFADLAQYINALGSVEWRDMTSIARSHFSRKIDGKVLRIRLHSTRVDVEVPPGIEEIRVERAWERDVFDEPVRYAVSGSDPAAFGTTDAPIRVSACDRVAIDVRPRPTSPAFGGSYAGSRPWPVVRRVLTEARDRLAPHLYALRGRASP